MCIRHVMMMGVYGGVHRSVRPIILKAHIARRLRRWRIHSSIHSSVASRRVASRRPVVVVSRGRRLVFVVTARRREETRRRHDARDGRDG